MMIVMEDPAVDKPPVFDGKSLAMRLVKLLVVNGMVDPSLTNFHLCEV